MAPVYVGFTNGTDLYGEHGRFETYDIILMIVFLWVIPLCCVCCKNKQSGEHQNIFLCCVVWPLMTLFFYIRKPREITITRIDTEPVPEIVVGPVDPISGKDYVKEITERNEKSGECPICWIELSKENEHPVSISCKHAFHQKCIIKWLEESKLECPLCRGKPMKI